MRIIKLCIFDMDGVICDTAKYHYLAWKALADQLKIVFTEEDNERLKGVSRMESLDILLGLGEKRYSDEQRDRFAAEKNKLYVESISNMTEDEILPGVLEFLRYCRAQGIQTALGSVSKNAMTILNNLHLTEYFDTIVDGTSVLRAKPDPEVFLKGAANLGVAPEYCVVFEDSIAGLQGARAAKMMAVGIGDIGILTDADIVIEGFGEKSASEMFQYLCNS